MKNSFHLLFETLFHKSIRIGWNFFMATVLCLSLVATNVSALVPPVNESVASNTTLLDPIDPGIEGEVLGCGVESTAPSVYAGEDTTRSQTYVQDATVGTDPPVRSYAWAVVSAPTGGNVTIGQPASEDTNISADTPGVYVLQLTVIEDCHGNSASDTFELTWEDPKPPTELAPVDTTTETSAPQAQQVSAPAPTPTPVDAPTPVDQFYGLIQPSTSTEQVLGEAEANTAQGQNVFGTTEESSSGSLSASCSSFLGLCWYWWPVAGVGLLAVAGLAFAWWFMKRQKLAVQTVESKDV